MQDHKNVVNKIATSVQQLFACREPFRIYHGSTNSTRQTVYRRENMIDISPLSRVLQVDTKTKTALVEPNVPMDRLIETTMKHGLIPPVVMEFPGITAGGGFAGTGGESSSFKYGYFNETVNSVEVVLGNGDIVTASDKENSDLFHGASGAVGTLGITTLLELQLISATKYVKVTYHSVRSIAEAIKKVQTETLDPALDYVDGILFSKDHGVVVSGSLTDILPENAQLQRFSDAKDPWYYLHVKEKTLGGVEPIIEYIPLAEYLFRYDRGGFWVGASAFEYFKFPFNQFTRWLLDDFLHTRMLYKALHASGESRKYIVQDLALPYSTAEGFIKYTIDSVGIWPLWLCPLRQARLPTFHPHHIETGTDDISKPMLNIGLWGQSPSQDDNFVAKNREIERKLREFGGMKWLYAHTYYKENEFWEMFDQQWYNGLRKKYYAESLPSVWHKVHVDANARKETSNNAWNIRPLTSWPFNGLWGIWKAIESGEYHIARNSTWKERDDLRRSK